MERNELLLPHVYFAPAEYTDDRERIKKGSPSSCPVTAKVDGSELAVATAEAAAFVAKADVAAATALAATLQAIADSLQHVAALGIQARDAAALVRAYAFALSAAEVEVADLNSVANAAARAIFVANGFAEALQLGAFQRIIAAARDSEAVSTFLKCEFARHRILNIYLWRCEGGLTFGCFGGFNHHIAGHNRTPSNEVLSAGLSRGSKLRASKGVARRQEREVRLSKLCRQC